MKIVKREVPVQNLVMTRKVINHYLLWRESLTVTQKNAETFGDLTLFLRKAMLQTGM